MLEYIILIADSSAVSFCHYENASSKSGVQKIISLEKLKSIVDYASKNNLALNVLFGRNPLPEKHLRILEKVKHVKIVPYELHKTYPDAIPVIDWDEDNNTSFGTYERIENVIVRLQGTPMINLRSFIRNFIEHCGRINLVFKNIEELTEEKLLSYEHQLQKLVPLIAEYYLKGKSIELNILSDRMLLNEMNNCEAGLRHVTYAPNGKFYICPGFYHTNPNDNIGSLETGMKIPNKELLQINHAPICSKCDAYHCKRCVYLNKQLTLEVNTPSRQQCVLSHVERNASRNLLKRLKPSVENYEDLQEIPEIDYYDPLDAIQERKPNNKIELYRICKGDI